MSLAIKGQSGLVLQNYGTLVTDRYGMSSATATWFYYGGSPEGQVAIFSAHPIWSFLAMDRRSIRHASSHWEIEGSYFGVDGQPEAIYEMDISTTCEPIESHPDFGTFSTDDNGAEFDNTDGSFIGFTRRPRPPSTASITNEEWIGVRDYLAPGAIWRKSYVDSIPPPSGEFNAIGQIDTPEGSAPTPSGRTWLYNSLTWERKGKTYSIRKEWRLSGRRGWNTTIYGA